MHLNQDIFIVLEKVLGNPMEQIPNEGRQIIHMNPPQPGEAVDASKKIVLNEDDKVKV